MKKIILIGVIAVFIMYPKVVYSCTCAAPLAPFEGATEIFTGKVIKIVRPLIEKLGIKKTYTNKVTFEVTKQWQGSASRSKVVTTRPYTESCGYPFEIGKEYFIVVFKERDIQTGICTGTKNVEDAEYEIQQMDKFYEASTKQNKDL